MRYRTRAWALLSGQSRPVTRKFWKVGWLSAPLENHGSRNLRVKSQLPKMQSIFSLAVRRQRMYAGREHRRSRAGELKMD